MQQHPFKINIKAKSPTEAQQKVKALASLGSQLSGEELTALAISLPGILADENTRSVVKGYLNLK